MVKELLYSVIVIMRMKSVKNPLSLVISFNSLGTLMGTLTLVASEKIIIYSLPSDDNDNQIFSDWNLTEIPVLVNGASSKHTKVVSKTFNSGEIVLPSGCPVCSSPLLVKQVKATDRICPFRIK